MAIYNGREVSLVISSFPPLGHDINVGISHKDGTSETVPFGRLQFTQNEVDQINKLRDVEKVSPLPTISDQDLQWVRDTQDRTDTPQAKETRDKALKEGKEREDAKNNAQAQADAQRERDNANRVL